MMRACTLAALLLCAVAAAAQSRKQPPPATAGSLYRQSPGYAAYQRANELFLAREFQECMNALDDALRLDPKLVPALTLRAKLAMAIDRYDVAREDLERAIAADPSSWYARFLYGFQFYQHNEMPAAIAALEKARKLNPRDPPAALYLGLAEESLGRTAEALVLYREAIRLEEAVGQPHAETILVCARLLLLMGEFDEEQRLLERREGRAGLARSPLRGWPAVAEEGRSGARREGRRNRARPARRNDGPAGALSPGASLRSRRSGSRSRPPRGGVARAGRNPAKMKRNAGWAGGAPRYAISPVGKSQCWEGASRKGAPLS